MSGINIGTIARVEIGQKSENRYHGSLQFIFGINIDTKVKLGYSTNMAKISKKKLSPEFKTKSLGLFFRTVKKIESVSDAEKFLDTFFTLMEKEIVLRRLATVILLDRGERYRKIQNTLEISRNTVSKIKHIISGDGYGRNLGKRVYSTPHQQKTKRKKLLPPYKGAESIIQDWYQY